MLLEAGANIQASEHMPCAGVEFRRLNSSLAGRTITDTVRQGQCRGDSCRNLRLSVSVFTMAILISIPRTQNPTSREEALWKVEACVWYWAWARVCQSLEFILLGTQSPEPEPHNPEAEGKPKTGPEPEPVNNRPQKLGYVPLGMGYNP